MNMDSELQSALEALLELPGVDVQAKEDPDSHHRCGDAWISITSAAGVTHYVAEFKRGVTTTTLPQVISQLKACRRETNRPPLLLAPYFTPGVTARLVEERIEFADAAGNVYIDGSAAYILVLGQKRRSAPTDSGFTATDLRLIFALLARPELRDATYRDLNSRTGVSLGTISATVHKLESLGHVSRAKSGALLLRDPESLLDRWEFGYLEQLRPSLHPMGWRMGPSTRLSEVRELTRQLHGILVGGEHAADAITKNLTPGTLTLHVPKDQSKIVASKLHLARGHETPNVVTLERFVPRADENGGVAIDTHPDPDPTSRQLAHPILVRAELLALDNPRSHNIADQLLADAILPSLRNDNA